MEAAQAVDANIVKQGGEESYEAAGEFWEADIFRRVKRSNIIAWTVAGIAIALAFLAVLALFALMPLKTVVPYIIEVDRISGEVKVKRPVDDTPIPQKEALDKYFLHKYLQARAGYDRNDYNERYRVVTAMSDDRIALDYAKAVEPANREGPVTRYGDYGFAKIIVREINFIAENTALIRFTKRERLASQKKLTKEGNATITYYYNKAPKDEETRLITPLGFTVNGYRVDPVLAETGEIR